MTAPTVDKVYVILRDRDKTQLEKLDEFLCRLFPYLNLTCNFFIAAPSLSDGIPKVERIQKDMQTFLRDHPFVRYHLHFLHPIPQGGPDDLDYFCQYYYQPWKLGSSEFDQEGYIHQEVPRLVLFPMVAPRGEDDAYLVEGLLERLNEASLLPSLYLHDTTFSMAKNQDLIRKARKVYYGPSPPNTPEEMVYNVCGQDLLEVSCMERRSGTFSIEASCSSSLFITADDGHVYPCMDAFRAGRALANAFEKLNLETVIRQCEVVRDTERDCTACRKRVIGQFAGLPLPRGLGSEVGALLYHLGAMYQASQHYEEAIRYFVKSLTLAPVEETGGIYLRMALCQADAGLYSEAVQSFVRAEPSYEGEYLFCFYFGLCHFQMGAYEEAVGQFGKALTMDPREEDLVRILIHLGNCYNSMGAYDKAREQLERAKATDSELKEVYSALGFSCFHLKDYDKAIAHWNKAVEIGPTSAMDYVGLGENYREKGDRKKAIAMFEKALALDPSIASARENLKKLMSQG